MAEKQNKVVSIFRSMTDGLVNVVANLGTDRDKSSHSEYALVPYSPNDYMNMYRSAWLPRKVVDVPAQDAVRRWRLWEADKNDLEKIEKLERELKVRGSILTALKKARLFGGAAVYIGTNSGAPDTPLGENEKIEHLTVMERRWLQANEIDMDPDSENFGKPTLYTIANTSTDVHFSRLIIFYGNELPDAELAISGSERGWGDSVLQSVTEAIKNADATVSNVASLVFEAKVDVIGIPDFMSQLDDPEYETLVMNRIRLAAQAKGINGMLLMDSEEEYEQKNANFSSLRDIIMAMMQVVSGASDIPMTRLLGMSPGGLSSTGESDIRNYYDYISSLQELVIEPAMERFDKLLVRNALGSAKEKEVSYEWAPLWQPTDKERAETGKTVAETIKILGETELFDDENLSEASIQMLSDYGLMPTLEPGTDLDEEEEDDDVPPVQQLPQQSEEEDES